MHIIIALLLCTFGLHAKESADYVVVGVGTAGATIAKLLTDDLNTSVIALHNGKNLTQNPDIKLTENVLFTVTSALYGSSFFQTGESIPQTNADDRQLLWAYGLPGGGDSSINAGAWARGTDQVYAQWEAINGPNWSTSTILDLYKSLENYVGETPNPAAHGFSGPLTIRQNPVPTPLSMKFSQAVTAATGFPFVLDCNNPDTPIGPSTQLQYTQTGARGQFRQSSVNAFLNDKVMTPNGQGVNGRKLQVKFKSTALRTIWKDNQAIGVEYFQGGKIKKVYADKGVIVCAGLYSSAFLMHSGVGSKAMLESLDIPVKVDNPHVGKNLADQCLLLIAFATNPDDTPISPDNTCNGQTFPSGINFDIALDLDAALKDQLLVPFFCSGFAFPGNSVFAQISWLPDPAGDQSIRRTRLTMVNPIPGLALGLTDLVQPLSRGSIYLNSSNPFEPPVIDNGMFSNPADLALYVRFFQTYIKNIAAAIHKMDKNYELIIPPPAVLNNSELLKAFIKESVQSNQCWQSHCLMAPLTQGGVVDSRGQVWGTRGLFVADDSIAPVPMDGTPMASAYMIAANIARLLLQN